MPAMQPGSLVLVTGASGYIGAHIVKAFLDQGYNVRGTVRSSSKGDYLVKLFENTKGKFEYCIVLDIAQEGAFDEAVKGVDGVAHAASPVTFAAAEPSELIVPAVNGTLGVLKSLQKHKRVLPSYMCSLLTNTMPHSPTVGRVVYTSSTGTIVSPEQPCPARYTEDDWNLNCVRNCEIYGSKADGGAKYRASKVLAEKSFWKFLEDEHPNFDGATIHPPLVYGPIIHQCDNPESLNHSIAHRFWPYLVGGRQQSDLPDGIASFVDVRDVGLAHVRALMTPNAGGNRFLICSGPFSGNDLCVILNERFPDIPNVPKGDPSPERRKEIHSKLNFMDGGKAARVLGIKYRPVEECVEDTVESLRTRFNF
ncbi:putative dihydrokaempferol 4-reductase [Naematelia encephala]|uniref:Putative dihydrokaempferol 4-reductase n=1 Tax=Naematelia encephala TaxID=71784 RepID=A0A1Y2B042_9TREE|nr:putative dihydrokaempferol 4-reductase [Naematelia encephala]